MSWENVLQNISPIFTFLKKITSQYPKRLYIPILLVIFYLGVLAEYKYQITKHIYFHNGFYEKIDEERKVKAFAAAAKPAISVWKAYHALPELNKERSDAREKAENQVRSYPDINQKKLRVDYRIYLKYFYAYLRMICADIDESNDCLADALKTIEDIEELESKPLDPAERSWLQSHDIFANLKLLKAQIYAIRFIQDPKSERSKSEAIKALKDIGGEQTLLDKNLHKDRLLSAIFNLAFNKDNQTKSIKDSGQSNK